MPFIPDENNPGVKFSTHLWRDENDNYGIANPYTTETEARSAFDKLEAGGQFQFGGLYRWVTSRMIGNALMRGPIVSMVSMNIERLSEKYL